MDTLAIETEERILVWENQAEIQRITAEQQTRLGILNRLNAAGLSPDQIKTIAASQASIDRFIFDRQLEGNKKLRELHSSGIHVPADLPADLQAIKYALTAWFNYRMDYSGSNKFSGLIHDGEQWQIDSRQLERHFEAKGLKIFVDAQMPEYLDIKTLCEIFNRLGMYPGQVRESTFLNLRMENSAHGFIPRGTYFRKDN